jgi:hypothetical protein
MLVKKCLAVLAFAAASVPPAGADLTNVQIVAAADTDYGTNVVATMVSDVLTAPDGLATYQVAFDVTPPAGRSIRSGITGTAGTSTNWSWGIGPENTLFNGDDNDRVEQVGNLRVTGFSANGGDLTLDDLSTLSFVSVTIANGQSPNKDSIELVVNGSVTNRLGNLSDNPAAIDLKAAGGVVSVTSFALAAVSDTNQVYNKWSVNQVEVSAGFAWRADWLRGSWGLSWDPEGVHNGRGETLLVDYLDFLDQISGLKTLDYLQLHLSSSYIYSPAHLGPHDVLESLWHGDTVDGKPVNLVVPRKAAGVDPFLEMLKAAKAAGLKTQVYVNSSQMLERADDLPNPDDFPDITQRWKAWCDTNTAVQAFISSETFHTDGTHTNRPYMFCYAEFILKDYAVRYGDLIDGWLFDSGIFMSSNGDNETNGVAADQRIFKAFADAVHAGNPDAAVAFNNGPERDTEELNPFSEAVLYEDYMFGHPYNGGNIIGDHDSGLYDRNYAHIEKMTETGGNVHEGELTHDWIWDDQVVGHFDPPMSTTAWNAGSTPALTDAEFLLWNLEAMQAGGAISWGAPLAWPPGYGEHLLIQDWGMAQLTLMDDHLSTNEAPGAPSWARAETPLPDAVFGQTYSHTLVDGVDFWDPETHAVTLSLLSPPVWLTLEEDSLNPGSWLLSGTPTETSTTDYEFVLRAADASGSTERRVQLTVGGPVSPYPVDGRTRIFAVANTNYGIDSVATLLSPVLTAPDETATFQIAFDVTPMAGGSIQSGTSGGDSLDTSWGIGSDHLFKGSDSNGVDGITNLRVTNFYANGGSLSTGDISDLSFEYAAIDNGQSTEDRVLAVVNGVTNSVGGVKMRDNPADLDLKYLGYIPATHVVLAVGNDSDTCKWSVRSIQVKYTVGDPDGFSAWASGYNLIGDDALPGVDTIDRDGYDNLAEFALGMDPTVADAGTADFIGIASEDGTNWFEYIHRRRSDYAEQGLSYLLIDTTNLVDSVSGTNTQDQVLAGAAIDGYEPVTNRYIIAEPVLFIELKIRKN